MVSRVLVMAGGVGLTLGRLNTIENKVESEHILEAIGKNNIYYQSILNDGDSSYSVWGYSDRDRNLRTKPPQKGDLIFITNKNAAIYFGEVFLSFESTELDFIWSGRKGWPYKILFKDVYQIFIPDPQNSNGKDFEKLLALNSFSPLANTIPHIKRLYEQGYGFRDIIEKTDKKGNFQGAMYLKIDKNKLLNNLEAFMIKSHFECVRKIV